MPTSEVLPPQQFSIDPDHPWYSAHWALGVRIYLNGIERERVVLADGPGRMLLMQDVDALGNLALHDDKPKLVRLEGDVAIVAVESGDG